MNQQAREADQTRKWQVWQAAQDRAERMWRDPTVSAQAKWMACSEAQAAEQQWSDAADAQFKAQAA